MVSRGLYPCLRAAENDVREYAQTLQVLPLSATEEQRYLRLIGQANHVLLLKIKSTPGAQYIKSEPGVFFVV